MSLDKAIKYCKEKRKPYYGCKSFDPACRNHGGCSYCERGRQHNRLKAEQIAKSKLEDYENDSCN